MKRSLRTAANASSWTKCSVVCLEIFTSPWFLGGLRLRCCATNRTVADSIPAGVSGFFIDIKSFRSHYGPGVDSASNRNECQEHFLGVKTAGAKDWKPYHHPLPLSWNLGTLTFWNSLGHSRPVTGLFYLYLGFWNIFPAAVYSKRISHGLSD